MDVKQLICNLQATASNLQQRYIAAPAPDIQRTAAAEICWLILFRRNSEDLSLTSLWQLLIILLGSENWILGLLSNHECDRKAARTVLSTCWPRRSCARFLWPAACRHRNDPGRQYQR